VRLPVMLAVLCACVVGSGGCGQQERPDPSSEAYQQAVASFYTGLAALQVGELGYAEQKLTAVTKQAPREPAAWANRGVLAMRRNAFEEATRHLQKARDRAPDRNAHIRFLQGVVARQRGAFAEAAEHLRRAAEIDSSTVKALYALAKVRRQQGGEGDTAAARVQPLLNRILEQQPGNLVILLEQARLAAGRDDAEGLRAAVAQIAKQHRDTWPAEAKKRFDALRQAAEASSLGRAATQVAFLENLLKSVPAYRADLAAVQTPAGQIGEPVARLLRLPEPSPNPAPPDDSLTFAAAPLATGDTGSSNAPADTTAWPWAGALSLMARQSPQLAFSLPSIVVADGRRVRIDTGSTVPFPGGPSATPPAPHGVAAMDYDYDFERDLVLAGRGGMRLFRHEQADATAGGGGEVTFTNVTDQLGLPASVTEAAYTGAWPLDLDQEGDVDLLLATPGGGPPRVLRNNGDGTFGRWTLFDEGPFQDDHSGLRDFAWTDLNGDGDPDAVSLRRDGRLVALENQRAEAFAPMTLPPQADSVRALDAADVNRDGVIDLLALRANGSLWRFSHRRASGDFESARLVRGSGNLAGGNARLFARDLDNNGGLDLLVSTAERTRVWLSNAQDQFPSSLGRSLDARVSAITDLDGNGRLDLVGHALQGRPVRLASRGAKNYRGKNVRPRAAKTRGDRRINPFGIGGEIGLRAGLLYQKRPIDDPVVHFGLGTHDRVDVARIVWPNGTQQAEFDLASDQSALARQRLKGSCPWLFAHNGEDVNFVTDLLWRTSLGLRINAQGTAGVVHSIDWVKIGSDALAPRPSDGGDGRYYDLRVTAELWETHFFDRVTLMTVDHPDTTRVFVNERFQLPPPTPAVRPMSPPRPVARAWDSAGRDVTDAVRTRDGRHLSGFSLGPYQGIAEEHYVEVKLGEEAPSDGPLWLVASGWVYPTDSSINLAVSQSEQPKPKGLTLEVPDGEGGWRVAEPNLGFPAGKNKTVLIDLSDVSFPEGAPRRLRLRTNMEIYWDRLAWAKERPDAKVRTRRLSARTAELRYRGFSATRKPRRSFPETPDYSRVARTGQVWRDLVGYHTRFGPVRELVTQTDDRYVIMNAGDELALRFTEPPPPEDWTRDFVLVNDGWVKDGDYNTGHSKTVRPLPYHGMSGYARAPGPLAQDSAYQKHPEDWQTYHTRYVTPRRFQTALAPPVGGG
jgi:Tfp pilus assembly protein PilF